MSRAYIVYILMFAVLVAGLWVLLTFGDSLSAPDDLSGEWVVHWDADLPPFAPNGYMRINQSGRYFTVRFERGPILRLKLDDNWAGAEVGQKLRMTLRDPRWTMRLTAQLPPKEPRRAQFFSFDLRGPNLHARGAATRGQEQLADAVAATLPSGTANAR